MKQIALALIPNADSRAVKLPEKISQRATQTMAALFLQLMKARSRIAEDADEQNR